MKAKVDYPTYFDAHYADRGGVEGLLALYRQGMSNPAIAKEFGLTEQGTTSALKKLLGPNYMRRPLRQLQHHDQDLQL